MQPYEMLWRTDENGTPNSVAIEEQFIVGNDLYMVLEEIPDSYQRVSIESEEGRIYEAMNRNQLTSNRFYVDYNNGIIYFDMGLVNKKLTINYYGRGFKRVHNSRVVGSITLGNAQYKTVKGVDTNDLQEQINTISDFVRKQQRVIEMLTEEIEKLQQRGDIDESNE